MSVVSARLERLVALHHNYTRTLHYLASFFSNTYLSYRLFSLMLILMLKVANAVETALGRAAAQGGSMQLRPKRGRAGGFLGEAGQPSADAYDDADLAAAIAASLSAGHGGSADAGGSGAGAGGSDAGPSTTAAAALSGLGGGGRRGGGRGNGLDDADLAAAIAASLDDQPGPSTAVSRPVVPLSSLGQAAGPMSSLFAAGGGRLMQVMRVNGLGWGSSTGSPFTRFHDP